MGSLPTLEHITPDDEDVLREENAVKKQVREGIIDPNVSVEIRGLVKTYPGTTKIGCCKCTKTSPYHAIKVKNPSQLHFLGHIASMRACSWFIPFLFLSASIPLLSCSCTSNTMVQEPSVLWFLWKNFSYVSHKRPQDKNFAKAKVYAGHRYKNMFWVFVCK